MTRSDTHTHARARTHTQTHPHMQNRPNITNTCTYTLKQKGICIHSPIHKYHTQMRKHPHENTHKHTDIRTTTDPWIQTHKYTKTYLEIRTHRHINTRAHTLTHRHTDPHPRAHFCSRPARVRPRVSFIDLQLRGMRPISNQLQPKGEPGELIGCDTFCSAFVARQRTVKVPQNQIANTRVPGHR